MMANSAHRDATQSNSFVAAMLSQTTESPYAESHSLRLHGPQKAAVRQWRHLLHLFVMMPCYQQWSHEKRGAVCLQGSS